MLYEDASRLRKQIKALYRRTQREMPELDGLSLTTFQMLRVIARSPTPIRPGQLADELEMTNSNVAAALRILEAKGLVIRRGDPADGRKAFLETTNLGAELVAKNRWSPSGWFRDTIDAVLTEKEQKKLLQAGDLLQRLTDYVEKPSASSPAQRRRAGGAGGLRRAP